MVSMKIERPPSFVSKGIPNSAHRKYDIKLVYVIIFNRNTIVYRKY